MALSLFVLALCQGSLFICIMAQYDNYHKLTYPEELAMGGCQLVFNTRDLSDANAPAFCGATMPCDCNVPAFNSLLLEEDITSSEFNLTDHSSLDFTINLGVTYLFDIIKFTWLYRDSPINQA
eukprot:214657_1